MSQSRDHVSEPESPSSAATARPDGEQFDVESAPTVVRGVQRPPSGGSADRVRLQTIDALVGAQLGPYRIEAHIGSGGMGTVFRALDVRLNRLVALKVLPPEFADDSNSVRRFLYEAQWAARLDHENIARVYDIGSDKGYHYIAFEYVDGRSVRDLLAEKGALDQVEVVRIALQVVGALCHAAARGVVHRDIKPSNLIITRSGRVKLVDMGLARTFERRGLASLTETGMTLGTFDYIAPEQARDPRSADIRSDIYSLGCTMFHMLSGRPPYLDPNPVQKLLRHQNDPPPDIRQFVPNVNRSLARVLDRMLQKDPAQRYQTPEELMSDLIDVATELNLKPVTSETVLWIRRRWSDRTTALLVGLWATVIVGVLVLLFLIRYPFGWGESAAAPAGLPESATQVRSGQPAPSTAELAGEAGTEPSPAASETEGGKQESQAEPAVAREEKLVQVQDGAELREALARCPDGAVIELAVPPGTVIDIDPDGRAAQEGVAGLRVQNKTVTIRPGNGWYGILRLTVDSAAPDVAEWAFFELENARLNLRHITLVLRGTAPNSGPFFFVASASDVNLSDVVLVDAIQWEEASSTPSGRTWVFLGESRVIVPVDQPAEVAGTDGEPESNGEAGAVVVRPSRLRMERCFVGPVHGLALASGQFELRLEDTTVAWADRVLVAGASGYLDQDLPVLSATIRHSALHFGRGPCFELLQFFEEQGGRSSAVLHVESSVVATLSDEPGALVALDGGDNWFWQGQNNHYYRLARFLVRHGDAEGDDGYATVADTLWAWREQDAVEDVDSAAVTEAPWTVRRFRSDQGAPHAAELLSSKSPSETQGAVHVGPRFMPPWQNEFNQPIVELLAAAVAGKVRLNLSPTARSEVAGEQPEERNTPPEAERSSPMPESAGTASTASQLIVDPTDDTAYHSLADALAVAPDDAVIVLNAEGEFKVPPLTIKGKTVRVQAAANRRPVLRLDPLAVTDISPRAALFSLRDARLVLSGVDIVLDSAPAGTPSGPVAFSLLDSEAQLTDCRVVVSAPQGAIAEVTATASSSMAAMQESNSGTTTSSTDSASVLRVQNSILLARNTVVRAPRTARVTIEMDNVGVLSLGSVLTVAPADGSAGQLDLVLRNSTWRARTGLIRPSTNDGATPTPPVRVRAEECLIQLTAEEPAIVLTMNANTSGQLSTSVIEWTGRGNVYDLRGPWLEVRNAEDARMVDTIGAGDFMRPPYRRESDSRINSIAFRAPLPAAEESVDAVPSLFVVEQTDTAKVPGVRPEELPSGE